MNRGDKICRRRRSPGARSQCLHTLYDLLKRFNHLDLNLSGPASSSTARGRRLFTIRCVHELHDHGFKLSNIRNLDNRHVRVLMQQLEARGNKPATLQTRRSWLVALANWIDKPGMIQPLEFYLVDPNRAQRDRSPGASRWSECDVRTRCEAVFEHDRHVGVGLMLMHAFDLRPIEAWFASVIRVEPSVALRVTLFEKGGRKSYQICHASTAWQQEVMQRAALVANGSRSLIPQRYSRNAWSSHFYRICRRFGFSRSSGLTTDRLRALRPKKRKRLGLTVDSPSNQ